MSSFWGIYGLIGVISFLRQLNSAYLGEFLPVMGTLLQQMDAQNGGEPIGRPTTLGAGLGIVGLDQIISAFHGTTFSISPRNRSHLVRFLAVDCTKSPNPSCLLPRNPFRTCDFRGILARMAWVFQGLPQTP